MKRIHKKILLSLIGLIILMLGITGCPGDDEDCPTCPQTLTPTPTSTPSTDLDSSSSSSTSTPTPTPPKPTPIPPKPTPIPPKPTPIPPKPTPTPTVVIDCIPAGSQELSQGSVLLAARSGSEIVIKNISGITVTVRVSWDKSDPWGNGDGEDSHVEAWVPPNTCFQRPIKHHTFVRVWAWNGSGGLAEDSGERAIY